MPSIQLSGTRLAFQATGSGEPVVLIHGLGSSGRDWEAQVAALARAFRVITVDLRGHGGSDRPKGPYSIAEFAGDVARLLASLAVDAAHVVGISMGGAVAFQLAVDHPQRVRSLVIVNSAPEMIVRTLAQKLAIWQRRLIVRLFGLPRLGALLAARLFPDAAAPRAAFAQRFAGNSRHAYLASLNALVGWSVADRLDAILCPTLVVASDQDYTPVALKEDYVARLRNARLVVIPDSRHAVPMERPEAFNRVLGDWFAQQAAAPQ
jgi:pimeloyl-ACP methyl ester carboxylesterase